MSRKGPSVNCKKCGSTGVNPSHVRWCKGKETEPAPASAASSPQIVTQVDPVPEAQLPNFESPESQQKPTTLPSGAPDPNFIPSSTVVRPIIDLLMDGLEKRLQTVEGTAPAPTRPAPISESERNALATVYGGVLDKYLPAAWMQKYGLEVSAVLLTVTIIVPKIFEYRAYYKSLKKDADKAKEKRIAAADTAGFNYENPEFGRREDEALKNKYEAAMAKQQGVVTR